MALYFNKNINSKMRSVFMQPVLKPIAQYISLHSSLLRNKSFANHCYHLTCWNKTFNCSKNISLSYSQKSKTNLRIVSNNHSTHLHLSLENYFLFHVSKLPYQERMQVFPFIPHGQFDYQIKKRFDQRGNPSS